MTAVHLILFSRAPVAGQTKTRLARDIGPEPARDIHLACLADAIETLHHFKERRREGLPGSPAPAEVNCHLFITPPGSERVFSETGLSWPAHFRVWAQSEGDLGARMADALAAALEGEENGRALLMGSDLPLLTPSHLEEALAALDTADVVFGPSEDGGYYLVGMKQLHPRLFEPGQWGRSAVLAETLKLAEREGLRPAVISPLPDVDTLADLERVRAHPLFETLTGRRAVKLIRKLGRKKPVSGAERTG